MNEELRLEVLRLVMVSGSENDRRDPLPKAQELLDWITKPEVERKQKAAGKGKAGE